MRLQQMNVWREEQEGRGPAGEMRLGDVRAPWGALAGVDIEGYEIRAGRTAPVGELHSLLDGLAWQNAAGNVLGLYMHGLFENTAALRALFGAHARTLDASLDALATEAERAFGAEALRRLVAA